MMFQLVDVFGTEPFTGNPLAVVKGLEGSAEEMQRITRWLNLSETAFLLPPINRDADYRVRIFTLERELPFAGHPTLGSCHAWLQTGGRPRRDDLVVQECGAGLIEVKHGGNLSFAAPPLIRDGAPTEDEIARAAAVLQIERNEIIDTKWCDNGPGWIAIMLASAAQVLAIQPVGRHDHRADIGVVGPHDTGGEVTFELRAFFSDQHGDIREDPVTGSLNASVGQWLFASGHAQHAYVAAQGTRLGRSGRVAVSRDAAGQVWVGGRTITLFSGRAETQHLSL